MPDSAQILARCALEIAPWTRVWSRLRAEHVAGKDGRCRGCWSAARSAPRWPCRLAVLAAAARAVHDRQILGAQEPVVPLGRPRDRGLPIPCPTASP